MQEIRISEKTGGQRLDKFLFRYLPGAPHALLYKQLRKKNITVNGARAEGSHILQEGEAVQIFFSEETIRNFRVLPKEDRFGNGLSRTDSVCQVRECVVYEDEDVLIVDKPAGILSQKASVRDISLTEMILDYLEENGRHRKEDAYLYNPGPVNRLDRNTSGLIVFALDLPAAHSLTAAFRERIPEKYYVALVHGEWKEASAQRARIVRDPDTKRSRILPEDAREGVPIAMTCTALTARPDASMLKIRLATGRTHQIRAHLAHLGHPILGDPKYGIGKDPVLSRQALHAAELVFPMSDALPQGIAGKTFRAPLPEDMAARAAQLDLML